LTGLQRKTDYQADLNSKFSKFTTSMYVAGLALRDTVMRLRSQRPLHVQGDDGHPG
jgi:hypothetical protein